MKLFQLLVRGVFYSPTSPTRYRVERPRSSTDLRATLPEVCEGYGRPKNFGVVATFIAGVLWVADIYLGEFTRVFKSSLLPLYG